MNEFRREANFEMVVAKSERYLSSTIQDRYLTRAIRQHEGKNTILVLNKADVSIILALEPQINNPDDSHS